jgi:hypothetical protein
MARELFTLAELDAELDLLAADPDNFEVECERLAKKLDRANRDLEIADPSSWKRPPGTVSSSADPFRVEVESIETIDRETASGPRGGRRGARRSARRHRPTGQPVDERRHPPAP